MIDAHIIVVRCPGDCVDGSVIPGWLRERALFKTLSLVLAHSAGIPTLPALLLCSADGHALEDAGERWGWPLMVRMDFTRLPRPKPLGGVPIHSLETAIKVSDFLFKNGCIPLFHPHADRFTDKYSAGLLCEMGDKTSVHAEVVGHGFDAGDLRLGRAVPHEAARMNLRSGAIDHFPRIAVSEYASERAARLCKADALRRYVSFVNCEGRLAASAESPEVQRYSPSGLAPILPQSYTPLTLGHWQELRAIALAIHSGVLEGLPQSKAYAASLSLVPAYGWILWDIYGGWYKR